ncbi:aminopeptidase P family protein [Rubrivirga litoralis]|uniref:Xaa-Pro aminopeptidase n=1 Tax=Rubrivirga litoralis TaxID=3075598 RepID=A0ABU3BN56_9BACT|nr:Xaa-Pro aminopeptidase [Rubrivirga sp. F394]MDT0630731.1 Xaa-Pro aminopeptidase [Rubrivirga sp. F394]
MFAPTTYATRRAALAEAVGTGLIVLPGNDAAPMNYAGNVYAFRQDGAFRYYAGLDAPGLALALDAETGEAKLYGHDPTLDDVVWEGPLDSLADRAASVGVERTAPPDALADDVRAARRAGRTVHTLPPYRGAGRLKLAALLGVAPDAVEPSSALVDAVVAQRLVKTDEEVAQIERALDVAADMHRLAMRLAQPGRTEQEVAGQMEGLAIGRGSHPSFPIILTRHGEVLHGHPGGAALEAGDLMLADAGAVAPGSGYAADVTRVAPVGGAFSDRQRAVVEVVLGAQEVGIDGCRAGALFRDVHHRASVRIAEGLGALGLMAGDPEEAVEAGAHALFFPHGLGHPMGLDVHDMEGLGEDRVGYDDEVRRSEQFGTSFLRYGRRIDTGHVMTVEPGVYLIDALIDAWKAEGRHAEFLRYDEIDRWRGLGGVRIEDDVLVTDGAPRVLGPGIPKRPDEVEAVVRSGA